MSIVDKFIPTYGNWGGPGWSAGQRQSNYDNTNWKVKSIDTMDEIFKNHDKKYQISISKFNNDQIDEEQKGDAWIKADKVMVEELNELPKNPTKWENTPPSKTFYAWFYRKFAIFFFGLRMKYKLFY